MGWCSGTDVFDSVVKQIILSTDDHDKKVRIIVSLIIALEGQDWDCQSDSDYYDAPCVQDAFKQVHPEWFEEEVKPIKPTPMPDITVSAVQLRQILDRIARLTDLLSEQTHRTDVLDKLFRDEMDLKSKFNLKVEAQNAGQTTINNIVIQAIQEIKDRLAVLEKLHSFMEGSHNE